jgi:hypothetical protein
MSYAAIFGEKRGRRLHPAAAALPTYPDVLNDVLGVGCVVQDSIDDAGTIVSRTVKRTTASVSAVAERRPNRAHRRLTATRTAQVPRLCNRFNLHSVAGQLAARRVSKRPGPSGPARTAARQPMFGRYEAPAANRESSSATLDRSRSGSPSVSTVAVQVAGVTLNGVTLNSVRVWSQRVLRARAAMSVGLASGGRDTPGRGARSPSARESSPGAGLITKQCGLISPPRTPSVSTYGNVHRPSNVVHARRDCIIHLQFVRVTWSAGRPPRRRLAARRTKARAPRRVPAKYQPNTRRIEWRRSNERSNL